MGSINRGFNNMTDKSVRHKYMKRTTIKNGMNDKIVVYYNNFMACNNIDKNIKQVFEKDFIEKEKRIQELFPEVKSPSETECLEILNSVLKTDALSSVKINSQEYDWFKKLIHMVENIPICITISSAKKEHFGFPLVYVNKEFEKTTEYDRNIILGQNCKFLQPSEPLSEEIPQHSLLIKSLREGTSTSVILTNVKKNGMTFYNLFTLKPVFDIEGNYIYCIGIQTEITSDAISHTRAQNIIDVLNILCD